MKRGALAAPAALIVGRGESATPLPTADRPLLEVEPGQWELPPGAGRLEP